MTCTCGGTTCGYARNRQTGNGNGAKNNDHDGNDHRENGTVDEKSCHEVLCAWLYLRGPRYGVGLTTDAGSNGQQAFDDHLFARLEALLDDPVIADTRARF